MTITIGFLVGSVADRKVQDRDGAPLMFSAIHQAFTWLGLLFAYGGQAGRMKSELKGKGCWKLEMVKRSNITKEIQGHPAAPGRGTVLRLFRAQPTPRQRLRKSSAKVRTSHLLAAVQQIKWQKAKFRDQRSSLSVRL